MPSRRSACTMSANNGLVDLLAEEAVQHRREAGDARAEQTRRPAGGPGGLPQRLQPVRARGEVVERAQEQHGVERRIRLGEPTSVPEGDASRGDGGAPPRMPPVPARRAEARRRRGAPRSRRRQGRAWTRPRPHVEHAGRRTGQVRDIVSAVRIRSLGRRGSRAGFALGPGCSGPRFSGSRRGDSVSLTVGVSPKRRPSMRFSVGSGQVRALQSS
jgi:hypothetical protein